LQLSEIFYRLYSNIVNCAKPSLTVGLAWW